jgi:hypothetical protein
MSNPVYQMRFDQRHTRVDTISAENGQILLQTTAGDEDRERLSFAMFAGVVEARLACVAAGAATSRC